MSSTRFEWGAGLLCLLLMLIAPCGRVHATQAGSPPQDPPPDLVLRGEITDRDHQHYREVPFAVPDGTARITVQFEYTGRADKTTIDLGLLDPDGIRGWSGGNKSVITVAGSDATPSYRPGAIRAGRWALLLGIPNIRPRARAPFTARIWFGRPDTPYWVPAIANPPFRGEPGWYRGDLHMHDAHSDGSCTSQGGAKVPCPLFLTAQAAAARGLDFIAITDHNTTSQANAIRELQPWFDRLLLIPGREITTFSGHTNLIGSSAPLDFRVAGARDWNALLRDAGKLHGVIAINHPIRPSDERCLGCGWTARPAADPALLQAVEVVNGDDADTPASGIAFWEALLDAGYRLTAIGGSDNHDAQADAPGGSTSPVGRPTTVVHAQALSMPAVLDALRAGHAFVDVQGSRDRLLEFGARNGDHVAQMGDALPARAGDLVAFEMRLSHLDGARIELIADGRVFTPDTAFDASRQRLQFTWRGDGKRHWIRANVRDAQGALLVVGNPVYLEP